MATDFVVVIHGSEWKLADIQDLVAHCRKRTWRRQRWVKRDALVQDAGTKLLYIGQPYNPADFKLVRGGWTRDHCEICGWELFESADEARSAGYVEGRNWLCSECYHQFIERGGKPRDIRRGPLL